MVIVIANLFLKGTYMYYNNKNPFGRDSYSALMIKDARRDFSRFHLGILFYIISAYVISLIVDVVILIFAGDVYETLINNVYYQWIMGVLPMYAVGLPILFFTVRKMPKTTLQKSKLSATEFIIIFLIAQTLMAVGNTIGTTLNGFFGSIKGEEITNSTSELIENSPIWLTVVIAVIIGPIIEEFIFRKLMLDRLSRYGAAIAIIVSGVSFGLFHGNFYQFFYAALLGMLLAFVTIKTGNWLYSVLLHVIINFFGSVVALPFVDMIEEFSAGLEALEAGADIDARLFINSAMGVISYSVIQYAMIIAGAILLSIAVKNKWYKLKSSAKVNIPKEEVASAVIFNLGTMLYLGVSIILFALSVILG